MLGMEQLLSEINGEELNEQGLPPGFRFHPTDEELITFYLASKVFKGTFSGVQIAEVDLNRCEPWELPDVAKMGEREWYFYSVRDRKYPTGLRTNRATGAGYWKATGKDREVYSNGAAALLGMKKTLVFYKGRAPRGQKTKWVMHEYRLDGDFSYRHASKEEWVICRIIHKNGEKKNPIYPISSCQSYMLETSANTLPPLLETNPTPTLIECQSHSHSQTAAIQQMQMQMQMQAFQNPFDQIHNNNNNNPYNSENDFKTLVSSLVSQSNFLSSNNDPFFQSSSLYSHKPPVSIINDTNITSNGINAIANSNNNMFNNTPSPSALLPSVIFKSLLSNQDFPLLKQESDTFKQTQVESGYSHFELPNSNSDLMDMKNQPNLVNYQQQQEQENPLFYEMECNGRGVDETSTSIAFNRAGYQTMLDPLGHGESWPLDA